MLVAKLAARNLNFEEREVVTAWDFEQNGFEIWGLYSNPKKTIHLDISGIVNEGKIEESGFVF